MHNFDQIIERKNTNSIKFDGEKNHDPKMIPMWVADMDFETVPEVKQTLIKRAEHGIFGYAAPTPAYFNAIIQWMKKRHDLNIQEEWIVPTCGVVTSLKLAVRAFTKENDKVMIMKPVYYPFDSAITLNKRQIVECPLDFDGSTYTCDYALFEKNIVDNDVKMFILCNPHNPIGKVWSRDDLYQMGKICQKHSVIVVSDEIHMDFIYSGHQHFPFYNVDPSFKDFSIICTAPSKTFNLAALHTSNIIIADKKLREAYLNEKQMTGVQSPNIFGLEACEAAYTYGEAWLDELLVYLEGNLNFMKDFINQYIPQIKVVEPEGLYLVWVDMRNLQMNNETLEKFMLEKAHLWLDEGYIFGQGGEGFERFNIACHVPL